MLDGQPWSRNCVMRHEIPTHLEMHLVSPNEAAAIAEKEDENGFLGRRRIGRDKLQWILI